MKNFIRAGVVAAALGALMFFGGSAFAADYTITIDNNVASKNQEFVFQYLNIGPGFVSDAPIHIINNANSSATVELIDIQPINSAVDPSPPPANNMLPYATLSLLRDGVVIAEGANGAYEKLIDSQVCVPALQTEDLTARFALPSSVGNEAQNTSMWIRYYFRITTGDCKIVTPPGPGPGPDPTPLPPPTSETMLPFMVVGGLSAFSLVLLVILGTTFLAPLLFKRKSREKASTRK